jgi:hypothetical protein
MVRFVRNNRAYYTTRAEAEKARKKGQTIRYSSKYNAYYVVTIKNSGWWMW